MEPDEEEDFYSEDDDFEEFDLTGLSKYDAIPEHHFWDNPEEES